MSQECEYCQFRFADKSLLKQHVKEFHVCVECGERSNNATAINRNDVWVRVCKSCRDKVKSTVTQVKSMEDILAEINEKGRELALEDDDEDDDAATKKKKKRKSKSGKARRSTDASPVNVEAPFPEEDEAQEKKKKHKSTGSKMTSDGDGEKKKKRKSSNELKRRSKEV